MERFTQIGRTGRSVAMRASGATRLELVEHASAAMFSIGWDLAAIPPTYSRPLVAPGDTLIELIGGWLEELLAVGKEEGIVWSQATVDRLEVGGVQGSAAGQYRADLTRLGPVAVGVGSVGPMVEIPDGYWIDLEFETDVGLSVV